VEVLTTQIWVATQYLRTPGIMHWTLGNNHNA